MSDALALATDGFLGNGGDALSLMSEGFLHEVVIQPQPSVPPRPTRGPLNTVRDNAPPPSPSIIFDLTPVHYRTVAVAMVTADLPLESKLAAAIALLDDGGESDV